MPHLNFTIDSALLRELGERLVGKSYIALAELVKNGYDADAHTVTIRFLPDQDRIEVQDDGHGMDFDDFREFWMRIGTTHKTKKRVSRDLNRPMTGSKGVGRLSVQFLAKRLKIVTVPKEGRNWLGAKVSWGRAVRTDDLTKARVAYIEKSTPPPCKHGTLIMMNGLKQEWTTSDIQDLARELWWLQPPFRLISQSENHDTGFYIQFESTEKEFEEIFNKQMRAILDIWTARVVGKNDDGHVKLALQFEGETPQRYDYHVKDFPHNNGDYNRDSNLNSGSFELWVCK